MSLGREPTHAELFPHFAQDMQDYLNRNCGIDVEWETFRVELQRRNTTSEQLTIKHPLFKQLVEDYKSGAWQPVRT
jgi:hypothetical protein